MSKSDRRVKLQNESLAGVRILKLNAWEGPMAELIGRTRDEELGIARSLAYINAFVSALISASPILVAVGAFALYSGVMGHEMQPWIVFPSLTLFSQLRFPIMFYPRVLSMCARPPPPPPQRRRRARPWPASRGGALSGGARAAAAGALTR